MKLNARPANAHYQRRRLEMLIFVAVCIVGVFALGEGLHGVFSGHAGVDLGWLAIAAGAFWVLYAQMCRVQQSWPRRPDDDQGQQPPVRTKEKA